jgi:GH25 family lysozyme M1 (1,4-beta-N-acetylmuramidase)
VKKGIDVHGAKGVIKWPQVRAAGFEFAFLKATEGRTFDDERFAFNRRAAKAAGLAVGAYHFARPDNNTAAAEAAHFLRICQVESGDLLPVLDWEHPPATADWALQFLRGVENAIGAPPIFYTFPDFLRQTGSHQALSRYPLWFASYGPNDGNVHTVNPPSQFKFVVHQFTSRGRVPGVGGDVDLNLLKLDSLDPILYKPGEPWRGEFDLIAGDRRVSVGMFRDDNGRVTREASTWIDAVRAERGHGRVAPHVATRDFPEDAVPAEMDVESPPNPEGDGTAGSWAETSRDESDDNVPTEPVGTKARESPVG